MKRWAKGWFDGPVNTVITLAVAGFAIWAIPPVLRWALIDANWTGTTRDACTGSGACWVFIRVRLDQFLYGFYPPAQQWRVDLAGLGLIVAAAPLLIARFPHKGLWGLGAVILYPPFCLWLLLGGLGLVPVETREWGGLMLTIFMSVYGVVIAIPCGILLALARRSSLPVLRTVAIAFIEIWRGVPIIAVIFLVSVLLPIILPQGMTVDKLLRAELGLALVSSAYMAEVVRGGLQALPKGQYEAAEALGLGYWQRIWLIVLPQAMRISIPPLVNEAISLFKNTTLVLIVSLFDLLGITQAALADPKWVGLNLEAYVFAGAVFWLISLAISRWSLGLERRVGLGTDRRH